MVLLLVDWVVVVIPLIRWYCGELHTTSLLPVLVVVHLVDLVVIMTVMGFAM